MNVQYCTWARRECKGFQTGFPMRKTWGIAGAPARPYEPIGARASFNMNGDSSICRLYPVTNAMPEQLWLPGLEAPPTPTDGLFFAVVPDANTAGAMSKFAQQLCAGTRVRSKPLAANRLHVTLLHLGNFAGGLPADKVDAAMRAAASINLAPFTVEFDAVASFASKPRPGPLVLTGSEGVGGLHELHDALGHALRHAGFGDRAASNATSYVPHVTLAYGMPWAAAHPVESVCWNVREFALIHSLLGRTRHVALARWPLVAAGS